MPKKKTVKQVVVRTEDPEVIADLKRQHEYGNVCEGWVEKSGTVGWVTAKSLAAFRRKQEREAEEKLNAQGRS